MTDSRIEQLEEIADLAGRVPELWEERGYGPSRRFCPYCFGECSKHRSSCIWKKLHDKASAYNNGKILGIG